jgi:hypothetical protein
VSDTERESAAARKLKRKGDRLYSELEQRQKRAKQVETIKHKLVIHKKLQGKGPRRKIVKTDRFGDVDPDKTVYVWKQKRKR